MKNYYQILGLEEGATLDEIKSAYKEYVVKFHPDRHNGDTFFKERFQEIQEAYDYLCTNNVESNYISNSKEIVDSTPLKSSDIVFSCSKSEIYEGETIAITWYLKHFCHASFTIYNGYKTLTYNDISSSGTKEITIKRIKGEKATITLYCKKGSEPYFKTIEVRKREYNSETTKEKILKWCFILFSSLSFVAMLLWEFYNDGAIMRALAQTLSFDIPSIIVLEQILWLIQILIYCCAIVLFAFLPTILVYLSYIFFIFPRINKN